MKTIINCPRSSMNIDVFVCVCVRERESLFACVEAGDDDDHFRLLSCFLFFLSLLFTPPPPPPSLLPSLLPSLPLPLFASVGLSSSQAAKNMADVMAPVGYQAIAISERDVYGGDTVLLDYIDRYVCLQPSTAKNRNQRIHSNTYLYKPIHTHQPLFFLLSFLLPQNLGVKYIYICACVWQ
jgi:hypothetical protein